MSAWANSEHARHEIAKWGYATPAACPHLRSPAQAFLAGAASMFDPFRSSMPSLYKYAPPAWADVIALRGDWGIYGMDQRHVCKAQLKVDVAQASLFDSDVLDR